MSKIDEIPDELVITLRKPVEHGGETYTELKLKEPTAGQLLEIDKHDGRAADVFSVSLIAGIPKGAIEKIGARDLIKGARYIASFLAEDPPTGVAS
ncbi:phage tail assembly protein [Flavisphingomonas formosensis]|uniref:phage tail assembly protein n=1 Tax=Flavisphingomonas formosensis TaxID=861534 RepID=UPI0012FB9870|nr:phage tail assembly protein [Sphingomonas formosensis]